MKRPDFQVLLTDPACRLLYLAGGDVAIRARVTVLSEVIVTWTCSRTRAVLPHWGGEVDYVRNPGFDVIYGNAFPLAVIGVGARLGGKG